MAVSRVVERLSRPQRLAVAAALDSPRYELMATSSAPEAMALLPQGATVTVTASPRRGLDPTIQLAVELAEAGFRSVPHLAARLIRDRRHLTTTVRRLTEAGVVEMFVVGGDGQPRGEYTDALGVIQAIDELEPSLTIGVAGYPETHPLIEDDALMAALKAKSPYADYVITQMCFDPKAIAGWIDRIRDLGLDLPVLIGIPGPIAVPRLLPMAARIGVGDSIKFLTRHQRLWRKLLKPRYSPDELVIGLAPLLTEPRSGVSGFHMYTFNQVEATERWRKDLLDVTAMESTP